MRALNDRQKKVLVVALAVHLVLVGLTWRDLRRRPDEAVRGSKRVWRLAASLNTTGTVAYWLFGRRWSAPAAAAAA